MSPCIFNIQKFSLHDGPGIRTVVFFKSCPLRCKWCSNPESQDFKLQVLYNESKCTKCLHCIQSNKAQNIVWKNNKINVSYYDQEEDYSKLCPNHALQVEGSYTSIGTICNEILKDKDFYDESNGGVTLSGGEVLSQAESAIQLCKELKKLHIQVAIETTGYAQKDIFQEILKHIDLLLFDVKHYDTKKHMESCGVANTLIIENMKYAIQKRVDIIARIPIIPGFNDTLEDAHNFCILLNEIGIKKVNLLPFHQMGSSKYEQLGMSYTMKDAKQLFPEDLKSYCDIMIHEGFHCTI